MDQRDKFHRIQERAYEIYLYREARAGTAESDRYEPEHEI